jgi:PhzF family phenazine biosynthesis protein
MSVPIFVVDAFTDAAFKGNPAGVCILSEAKDAAWMQSVAAEMKHAETAFLTRQPKGFDLRWFTPAVEVKLCGHATLASAHVLWQEKLAERNDTIHFFTLSGELRASFRDDFIWLDFPAQPAKSCEAPPNLLDALGAKAVYVGRSRDDYLVLVATEADVKALQPDHARLRKLPVRGVIVTAIADQPQVDFVSRFFAPGSGIDEDPVTGSAHCTLAVFWQEKLKKSEFVARQLSERGGTVRVRLEGDRVHLGGTAVTVLKGELQL